MKEKDQHRQMETYTNQDFDTILKVEAQNESQITQCDQPGKHVPSHKNNTNDRKKEPIVTKNGESSKKRESSRKR